MGGLLRRYSTKGPTIYSVSLLLCLEVEGHPNKDKSIETDQFQEASVVTPIVEAVSTTKSHNRSCQSKFSTDGFLTCERVVESSWAALFISPIKTKSLFKKNFSGRNTGFFDRQDWNSVPCLVQRTVCSALPRLMKSTSKKELFKATIHKQAC